MNSTAALIGILIAGGLGAGIAWQLHDKQKKDQARGRQPTTTLPPGLRRSPGQPTGRMNPINIRFPPGFPLINPAIRQTAGQKKTGACCATCEAKERHGIT